MSIAYVSSLLPIRLGRRSLFTGWRSGLTLLIAWRNLVHDRVRLAVTLIGIAFSTILMGIQLGMLVDCMHTTSTVVDHGGADIWIAAHGVRAVDAGRVGIIRRESVHAERFQRFHIARDMHDPWRAGAVR